MNEVFKLFGTIAINGVDEAQSDIKDVTNTAEKSSGKIISAFKKIGGVVATVFAVDKIVSFGAELARTSAEVAAEQSAFAQIMGDYSEQAQEKLGEIATATGKVDTELTPYMTSITAKFKGLGFGIEDATSYAQRGLLLASDACAFWDISLDESMSHLNSFINGSYEGGEAIGLFANDTQMAMYAIEQGIIGTKTEWANLDEATKQATRMQYAENMMALSGATGQARKEAGQYANVQAGLNEKWRQFKAMIGEPILQHIVVPAMQLASDAIDKMTVGYQKATDWISENKEEIKKWSAIVGSAAVGVATFLLYLNWGSIMQAAAASLGLVKTAFMKLNTTIASNPIGFIISLIASLITYLYYLYETNEDFRTFVNETFGEILAVIQKAFGWIQDNVMPIAETVFDFVSEKIGAVISFVEKNVLPVLMPIITTIKNTIGTFFSWLGGIFQSGGESVGSLWETIKGFFSEAWEFIMSVWEACQPFFQAIWENVILQIWELIEEIIGAFSYAWDCIVLVWDYVQPYFSALWEYIKAIFSVVASVLGGFFSAAWEAIKLVWELVKPYFQTIWEGIKLVFSVVVATLGGFFRTAWEVIKAVWNTVIDFFTLVWAGIKAVFAVVKGVLSGNFSDAWEAIKNVWNKVKDFFGSVWNGIKGIFGSVATWFGDIFKSAWTAIKNVFANWTSFFTGLWNKIKDAFSAIGTKIGDAISGAVKSGINGIIGMIEGIINTGINLINGAIGAINKIPGVDLDKLDKLELPRLARGGIVDRPTIAEIGEDGAEAVVPLEKNTGWIDKVAEKIRDASDRATPNDDGIIAKLDELIEKITDLRVYLDGDVLVGEIAEAMNARLGRFAARKARGV